MATTAATLPIGSTSTRRRGIPKVGIRRVPMRTQREPRARMHQAEHGGWHPMRNGFLGALLTLLAGGIASAQTPYQPWGRPVYYHPYPYIPPMWANPHHH